MMDFKNYILFEHYSSFDELDEDIYKEFIEKYKEYLGEEFWRDCLVPKVKKYFQRYSFNREDSGRHRLVLIFDNRNIVIKIPLNHEGLSANYQEFKYQEKNHARNKLFELKKMGIPILVMEKIKECPLAEKPDWAGYYDCWQVGQNKRGKFKAYDFGS